jgi:hypothetical protein
MKNQHRKLALRGETVRALTPDQLTIAHGGRMREPGEGPGATVEGCQISNGPCVSGGPSCGSLACPSGG